MVKQEWLSQHEELLGRLAKCREDLTDLAEEADLDEIEEGITELEGFISAANERKMAEEDDPVEEEDDLEEDEEEDPDDD